MPARPSGYFCRSAAAPHDLDQNDLDQRPEKETAGRIALRRSQIGI
jgi:hypothetical protein